MRDWKPEPKQFKDPMSGAKVERTRQAVPLASLSQEIVDEVIDIYDREVGAGAGKLRERRPLTMGQIEDQIESGNDLELRIGSRVSANSKIWVHLVGDSEVEGDSNSNSPLVYFYFDPNTPQIGEREQHLVDAFRSAVDRYFQQLGHAVPLKKSYY